MCDEDKHIFDLLLETGFRLDDILRLRRYHLSGNYITIKERKTCNVRTVPNLHPVNMSGNRLAYVFPSRRCRSGDKRKLHRSTFWRHFEKAVTSAGLDGCGYTVHSLRKCYAVSLYLRTRSLTAVQRDLGHKSIATTSLYLVDGIARSGGL